MRLSAPESAWWQVHWDPKSASLRRLSETLDLPLSSFVFIDDNPAEVLGVQAALPEVLCMRFPEAPEEQCAIVAHHWALDVWESEVRTPGLPNMGSDDLLIGRWASEVRASEQTCLIWPLIGLMINLAIARQTRILAVVSTIEDCLMVSDGLLMVLACR